MSITVLVIILVICLLLEGFFSGSEMALVSADKYRLALATEAGSRQALFALHMVKRPAKFFATTLLGTNLCTVAGSVATTFFIISKYGAAYAPLAILYWPLTLILGEIVPKSIYQHYADRIALRVAPVLFGASVTLYPVVWILSKLTDVLLGGVKRREGVAPPISREELELILEVGRPEASDVRPTERTMIQRIFDLAEKRVKNIMTPLVDVVSIPLSAARTDAERMLEKYGFSRVPVYEENAYNVVGVLAGTDLLFGDEDASVQELKKPVYYVSEEMSLDDLLIAMKGRGEVMAVAVDEYGAATGIVTTEDLLEEIVGEIHDEHDVVMALYQRLGRHRHLMSGRLEIKEANERLKLEIPGDSYKTIAGFVIQKFGRIPRAGDEFRYGHHIFTIRRATERTVLEVEVAQVADTEERSTP